MPCNHQTKPFGEVLPRGIWKIVEDNDGNTYRAVYTASFADAGYVLDVFMKSGLISYAVDGRQYVAVAAANTLFAFGLRP